MPRLIYADPLLERTTELEAVALEQVRKYEPLDNPKEWHIWSAILIERTAFKYDLMDAPTIEAVPVVRCKDCIHNSLNRKSGNAWCDFGFGLYQLDDFCSRGEKREDGDK